MDALRHVMDSASSPVFVVNTEGSYIYENQAAEALLGYDQAEITHKRLTDVRADHPARVLSGFGRLKLEGYRSGLVEYRLKRGGFIRAAVNVFLQTLRDGSRVSVSLVHQVDQYTPDPFWSPEPTRQLGLSTAEMRLLQLLADGFTDTQVAGLSHLDARTVGEQVKELLQKMHVSSRTGACVVALKTGAVL